MIEFASRAKNLPAPPHVVWTSLVDWHRPGARPWLDLNEGETEPRVVHSEMPTQVVWSSLWAGRPGDQIHFELSPQDGGTLVRYSLRTPVELPDATTVEQLGRRVNHLIFAELRYSYGG